jgi:hypothetical protein
MPKVFSSNALDGFANLCAYDRRQNFPPEFAGAQRTETMSSLRSHTVAKAAAALPFIRPCDWSRMSVTKHGPGYLTGSENLGPTSIAARA